MPNTNSIEDPITRLMDSASAVRFVARELEDNNEAYGAYKILDLLADEVMEIASKLDDEEWKARKNISQR